MLLLFSVYNYKIGGWWDLLTTMRNSSHVGFCNLNANEKKSTKQTTVDLHMVYLKKRLMHGYVCG